MNNQQAITVERLGIYGEGIGARNGKTLFIDGALPGEEVFVSVYEVKKTYERAKVLKWLKTSPHRVAPPCPVFGRCGGCQLQHLDYPQQLEAKRQRVIDALERIGGIRNPDVLPCQPSPNPYHYRNKIQLPVQDSKIGLYAWNSHELIEIDQCLIHCPLGEKVFHLLKRHVRPPIKYVLIKTAIQTNEVLIVFVTQQEDDLSFILPHLNLPEIRGIVQNINPNPGNTVLGPQSKTLQGNSSIEDQICGLRFKVSPASFFQVNPPQAENLYQKALEYACLTGTETVLDAYCGVGTLSLLLAQKAKKVIGIEVVPQAIEDAQANASLNNISNVLFICSKAEDVQLPPIDVALLNPPRKGCDPDFLRRLVDLKPHRIIYISCDPATLARDLKLLQASGYAFASATPFDMFPQTTHVEVCTTLQTNPSG